MTAFLKIDRCKCCHQQIPWEWAPPINLAGKTLAGTGVWRSTLVDGLCPACRDAAEADRERRRRSERQRERLIELLGGIKPYRDFTFEHFQVTAGNREAFEQSSRFDPAKENLYVWGLGRVGKTHLGFAIARTCFERGGVIKQATPSQLVRHLRMRPPDEEQQAIDGFVRSAVFLLDDFGRTNDTPYARLVLQEILDARDFRGHGGLVVTSRYSPGAVARRLGDDGISARLAVMCRVIEIKGIDFRPLKPPAGPGGGSIP
jgi:DNA replication protein DnaC